MTRAILLLLVLAATFLQSCKGAKKCKLPYYGAECDKKLCHDKDPCKNGAMCLTIISWSPGYICVCSRLWTGPHCDTRKCQNTTCGAGTCHEVDDHSPDIKCRCPAHLHGDRCEKDMCNDQTICLNGGKCQVSKTEPYFECSCPEPYRGQHCESNICEVDLMCHNGGTCHLVEDRPFYRCECAPGFYGQSCHLRDLCHEEPEWCANNSTCVRLNDRPYHRCDCPPGYHGPRCQKINGCVASSPRCMNGGKCQAVNDHGGFQCQCRGGFGDELCQTHVCEAGICGEAAGCRVLDQPPFYHCHCPPHLHGDRCEFDGCTENPCANGGECKVIMEKPFYQCSCRNATQDRVYVGQNCEQEMCVDVNPCLNDGECTPTWDSPSGFECNCPGELGGVRCEIDVCSHQPCKNGGECKLSGIDEWMCKCLHPFRGELCQISPCDQPDICYSNSKCRVIPESSEGFACDCLPGYGGKNCSEDMCTESPCSNGGSCTVASLPPYFTCQCTGSYNGTRCELPARSSKASVPTAANLSRRHVIAVVTCLSVVVIVASVFCCWKRAPLSARGRQRAVQSGKFEL